MILTTLTTLEILVSEVSQLVLERELWLQDKSTVLIAITDGIIKEYNSYFQATKIPECYLSPEYCLNVIFYKVSVKSLWHFNKEIKWKYVWFCFLN